MTKRDLVHVGLNGRVLALDRRTGAECWRAALKGSSFVNLFLDGDKLFATTRGEIFCLDALTGRLMWSNPMRGMGYGIATVGFAAGNSVAAVESQQESDRQSAAAASSA